MWVYGYGVVEVCVVIGEVEVEGLLIVGVVLICFMVRMCEVVGVE